MELQKPVPNKFFNDMLMYYKKATTLQKRNEGIIHAEEAVPDNLMMNVHIYDCIERRQAGFSNALEDLHGKRSPIENAVIPQLAAGSNKLISRFLHLIHRFTGSGASFEKDHGYRNSIIPKLVDYINNRVSGDINDTINECIQLILNHDGPTVTSIGNQPPSLKNPDKAKYRLAQHYYFDNFALDFIHDYTTFLRLNRQAYNRPMGIKEAVDWCCKWHKDRGFKQWHFILTAFVMDDAEYFPNDVDPESHCYYGPNCIRAFKLMFDKSEGKRVKNAEYYEQCMQQVSDATKGQPYSLEDVCCDMIRYWTEYTPKNGYAHLPDELVRNNSTLYGQK